MNDIMQTVKDYVMTTFLPDEDPSALTPSTPLITSGILDSLATLDLVAFLESKYGLEFEANEVDVSRLGTLNDIVRVVEAKRATRTAGA
jgi:acyl carrier protein